MTENEILELLKDNYALVKSKSEASFGPYKQKNELKDLEKERNRMFFSSYLTGKFGKDIAKDVELAAKELQPVEKPVLKQVFLGGAILLAVLWIVCSFIAPVPFLSTICIFGAIACGFLYYKKNNEIATYERWVECKKQYGEAAAEHKSAFENLVNETDAKIEQLKQTIEELEETLKEVPQKVDDELREKGFAEFLHPSWWQYPYFDELIKYLESGMSWEESFKQMKTNAEIHTQCFSCTYYRDCRKTKVLNCASYVPKKS